MGYSSGENGRSSASQHKGIVMSRIPKRAILKKIISFPCSTIRVFYDAKTCTWFRRTTYPDNIMQIPEEINSTKKYWLGKHWEVTRGRGVKANKIFGNDEV